MSKLNIFIIKYAFCIICLIVLFSCNSDKNNTFVNNIKYKNIEKNDVEVLKLEIVEIDTFTNSFAQFIAGIKTSKYSEYQENEYFKKHITEVEKSWNKVKTENLDKISKWTVDNNITNTNDTLTLFYPFSGPDFLFANAFFPYCKNYILFGLENPGSIPDLNNSDNETIAAYLENLRFSLRYINELGFFVTKQMKEDFKNKLFDGSLHIILFYIAKYGYDIVDFQPFYLNDYGEIINQDEILMTSKKVQGTRIDFKVNDVVKSLYYFQLDVSNINLIDNMEFTYFVNSFKNKITYLKSASYLMHEKTFSIIRDIIINQSIKILEDDTGIPFENLNTDDFEIDVFGDYTKTISLFKTRYQDDLKSVMSSNDNSKKLPFTIGYNAQFDETVLIFAKSKKYFASNSDITNNEKTEVEVKDENKEIANNEDVIYSVQFKISWDKLNPEDKDFEGMPNLDYYFEGNYYKYTMGKEKSETDCKNLLEIAKNKGYNDAFVAAFYKGKRISLEEAAKIVSK